MSIRSWKRSSLSKRQPDMRDTDGTVHSCNHRQGIPQTRFLYRQRLPCYETRPLGLILVMLHKATLPLSILYTGCISLSYHHQIIKLTQYSPEPPREVLQSLVKLYIDQIADQPLPLFDSRSLQSTISKCSEGLKRSFLALTVRYSNSDFFKDARSLAADFYKNSAAETLFAQSAEPNGDIETLQAFCLLCLSEIAGKYNFLNSYATDRLCEQMGIRKELGWLLALPPAWRCALAS